LIGMNYKKEAGKRLKAAREAKGMTLQELSKRVGNLLSPSRLSNYEQGTRMLGVREALALHSVLGVQPSHLLCVDVIEDDMTPQELELLRNFRALPEKDRNDYSRRIGVLALAYKEPVPDERLSPDVRKGSPRRTAQK
jgi:transcriptional regulator with XRE-family HTH domain